MTSLGRVRAMPFGVSNIFGWGTPGAPAAARPRVCRHAAAAFCDRCQLISEVKRLRLRVFYVANASDWNALPQVEEGTYRRPKGRLIGIFLGAIPVVRRAPIGR